MCTRKSESWESSKSGNFCSSQPRVVVVAEIIDGTPSKVSSSATPRTRCPPAGIREGRYNFGQRVIQVCTSSRVIEKQSALSVKVVVLPGRQCLHFLFIPLLVWRHRPRSAPHQIPPKSEPSHMHSSDSVFSC